MRATQIGRYVRAERRFGARGPWAASSRHAILRTVTTSARTTTTDRTHLGCTAMGSSVRGHAACRCWRVPTSRPYRRRSIRARPPPCLHKWLPARVYGNHEPAPSSRTSDGWVRDLLFDQRGQDEPSRRGRDTSATASASLLPTRDARHGSASRRSILERSSRGKIFRLHVRRCQG